MIFKRKGDAKYRQQSTATAELQLFSSASLVKEHAFLSLIRASVSFVLFRLAFVDVRLFWYVFRRRGPEKVAFKLSVSGLQEASELRNVSWV